MLSESAVYGGYCASHMNVLANAANTFMVNKSVESSVIENLNPPTKSPI